MRLRQVLVLALVSALCGRTALAQNAIGTYAYGAFQSQGADTINIGNLNVMLDAPILHKTGRAGTNFTYDYFYNGLVWNQRFVGGSNVWSPDQNWGWSGQTQLLTGYLTYRSTSGVCATGHGRFPYTLEDQFVYHDAQGVSHAAPQNQGVRESDGLCPGDFNNFPLRGGGDIFNADFTVQLPNNVVVAPPVNQISGAGTYTDSNGNQITTSGNGTFVDTTGNNALVISGTAPSNQTFTYKDTTGSNQSVTISYQTPSVQTAFGCSGVGEFGPTTVSLIDRITYPDGTYYAFTYEPTPGVSGTVTGRIASVQLRTGGTISYTYSGGTNGINCGDGTPVILTRTSSDGTTTYTRSNITTTTSFTDVQSGAGDHTTYNFVIATGSFNQPYPTHIMTYDGAASGTPRQETVVCYNGITSLCDTTVPLIPLTEANVTTTLDGSAIGGSDTKLDTYGDVTEFDQYDFGTSSRGALLHKTLNTYAGTLLTASTVQDGSGNLLSSVSNSYSTSVTATSGVPQHTSVSGARGNLTQATVCSTAACTALGHNSSYYTYDDTGSVLSVQNGSDTPTTITYDTATNIYPTTVTYPSTMNGSTVITHSVQSAYDSNTG